MISRGSFKAAIQKHREELATESESFASANNMLQTRMWDLARSVRAAVKEFREISIHLRATAVDTPLGRVMTHDIVVKSEDFRLLLSPPLSYTTGDISVSASADGTCLARIHSQSRAIKWAVKAPEGAGDVFADSGIYGLILAALAASRMPERTDVK